MKAVLPASAMVAALCFPGVVMADGGQPMSQDELQQLLSGAQVEITYSDGNKARWTNAADGTLDVQWQSGDATRKHTAFGHGTGTWKISDDGKYCTHVEWRKSVSDWCRPVVRLDDGTFVLAGKSDWAMKVSK